MSGLSVIPHLPAVNEVIQVGFLKRILPETFTGRIENGLAAFGPNPFLIVFGLIFRQN
jgi:hypothetical protein